MFNNINNVLYKRSNKYEDTDKSSKYMLQRWVSMFDDNNACILNHLVNPNHAHLTDDEFFKLMYITTPRKKYKKIKYIKKGDSKKNTRKSKDVEEIDLGSIFEESTVKIKESLKYVNLE